MVALRDVVEAKTGSRNPTNKPNDSFIYVDVAAVDNEDKMIAGARSVMGVDAPSRARKLIRCGDILVSTVRPNLNAVAMVPSSLDGEVASTGFCVLRANDRVLPEYLFFFVRSQAFVNHLCTLVAGALYPAVSDAQVLDQKIPLPSINDQRRIVDLLSRAEGIVRLRREAQKKAAELIPAIFMEMFGEPGRNPKGWPTTTLGDLMKNGPSNGLYKHKSFYGSGTPILRIDAFYDGFVTDLSSLKRLKIDNFDELQRFALAKDDIVVNRVNSPEYLGKSAIIKKLNEPTVFESNIMRFAVDTSRVFPTYIINLLQADSSRRHFIANAKHAINQSSINQQDVKSLPVAVPTLKLQAQFKKHVEAAQSITYQQTVSLTKAKATFDALLDRAFEG